jgi:bacteriorhodopsin
MKETTDRKKSSARSLWLWVVLAFALLISAWSLLIYIATENRPEMVEIEQR